jgi:phosphotransferase system IIB component
MKEVDRKYWRTKNGLDSIETDHNPEKLNDPSLNWVAKTDPFGLKEKRKASLIKELQKCEENFATHQNGQERIENRENCITRLTYKGIDTVTFNKRALKERRAKELVEDMTRKFGDQVLGVHGAELPKFT